LHRFQVALAVTGNAAVWLNVRVSRSHNIENRECAITSKQKAIQELQRGRSVDYLSAIISVVKLEVRDSGSQG